MISLMGQVIVAQTEKAHAERGQAESGAPTPAGERLDHSHQFAIADKHG
ncbi:MAG: hypothetical protein ACJAXR_000676 [Halopseudomonas sp.]|jgi:hypothetical protein